MLAEHLMITCLIPMNPHLTRVSLLLSAQAGETSRADESKAGMRGAIGPEVGLKEFAKAPLRD